MAACPPVCMLRVRPFPGYRAGHGGYRCEKESGAPSLFPPQVEASLVSFKIIDIKFLSVLSVD